MSEAHVPLQPWSLPLATTFALVVTALLYFRGWRRLRSIRPTAILGRQLSVFICGIMSVAVAVNAPVATMDHQLLFMHMVRHLLLMAVAPPLILLGAPFLLVPRGLPPRLFRLALDPLLHWAPMQWLGRLITSSPFCWLSASAVLIGWHFPKAFGLGMQSESWHAIQCASFLATGVLFWTPVIQPWPTTARSPQWSIPLYLFLATLPCDTLSAFLTFCGRVVYPHYLHAERPFNISALQDQESAGALMWVSVTFVYLIPAVIATIQLLSPANPYRQNQLRDVSAMAAQPSPLAAEEVA
jgi:putative membrane protein